MNRLKTAFEATRTYLREVLGELSKVVWPGTQRTIKLTGVVLGIVVVIAGYLYILDLPMALGLEALIGG